MNIALRIRPRPTHPLTLPATQETRSTQDILGPQDLGSVSGDPTPQVLNHPPVLLVHAEGGEVLLNRDAVECQLQLIANAKARVPDNLVVYALEADTLEMSLRSLQFLYGQLQPLNYLKKARYGESLAEIAANTLKTDRALHTAISRDLFGRTSLALRHYQELFAATNLGERSIRNLKNTAGKKVSNKKKSTKKVDTPLKTTTVMPINSTVDHENTTVVAHRDAACDPPPQAAKRSGAIHPPGTPSPTLSSSSAPREDHQFHLALIEEDA